MRINMMPVLAVLCLSLTGCASLVATNYSPDFESIDKLKKAGMHPVSINKFQPSDPQAPVNKISLRAASLTSPSGTFSQYLEDAMRSDLSEMGIYDASANKHIDATILKNDIDISGFSQGTGLMQANIRISQNAAVIFEHVYDANIQFESSFAGAVAIPKGQSQYATLVRELLKQVYSDPAFVEALKQ